MLYPLVSLTNATPRNFNQLILYLAAPQAQSPPPSYNAIDLSFNGYNWTYNYSNDTSQDMIPCQGNCMDPCTQQCSMSQDCCCCDPNLMAQTQMAAAPLPAAPAAPVAPAYQQASQATLKLQENFCRNTCICCWNCSDLKIIHMDKRSLQVLKVKYALQALFAVKICQFLLK